VEVYRRPDGACFCRTLSKGPEPTPTDDLVGIILVPSTAEVARDGRELTVYAPGVRGLHLGYPNRVETRLEDQVPITRVDIRADQLLAAARRKDFGELLVELAVD
jgi:hypothetical protein